MIEIKLVGNIMLNNIDLHDQPFRMHRSPPRSCQNFPDSKISKIVKSDTDISDLIIECFNLVEVVRNDILNLYIYEKLQILLCCPNSKF